MKKNQQIEARHDVGFRHIPDPQSSMMEGNTEDDHHGLQQDIQQIHKVLGDDDDDDDDLEEEEEEADDNERPDGEGDDTYALPGPSTSGATLPQVLSPSLEDSQPVLESLSLATPMEPSAENLLKVLSPSLEDSQPIPESLSLATPMEPSAENLLQINLSYQDMICTLLDNIKVARKKNAEIQKRVASNTSTYVKGARPITHFQKHYFSGHSSVMPPLSDEAREIKLKNLPTPFVQPAKAWTADEDRALYEGVRNDGLQRCMKPLMAKQEILLAKRQQTYGEEKQQITREINDITTQLEHLKAPEEELLGDRMRDIDWMKISSLHLNGERTEVECQLRWRNILHPSINMKAWAREEEQRLDEILENAQGRDWTDVINELGTNRSPFDCFSNFQHREISAYVSRPFTREEDEIISELAERFKVGNHIQFNKVAYFMDQRLSRQIKTRWQKKLDPESKFGFWTKEEDEALREGIETYGFKWSILTKVVKGRDSAQIRDRWKYTLDPDNTKGPYTFKEDITLLQCVKENGVGNWVANTKKLTEMIGVTRTPNSVLHRFNSLFHSFFKNAKGISLQEGAHMEVLSNMPLSTILDEMIEYRNSLGERKSNRLGSKHRDLYKYRRRRPRTPPPRLIPRNASVATRQHVLSELDKELMEAIKPIGWALPCPGHWRAFYGSKAVRRQRRHYLFSVLIKALDISIEGNEGLLASMLTNAEGVQTLKDHNLIPKAVASAPAEAKEKTQGKASKDADKVSKSKDHSSKSQEGPPNKDKRLKNDPSKGSKRKGKQNKVTVTLAEDADQPKNNNEGGDGASVSEILLGTSQGGRRVQQPSVTDSTGLMAGNILTTPQSVVQQGNERNEANVTELQGLSQKRGKRGPKNVKKEAVLQRPHSIFGQGTLQVGNGYLVPLQNYVSQFGSSNVPQKNVVTLMHPRYDGGVQQPVQFGGVVQPPVGIGAGMQPQAQVGTGVQPSFQIGTGIQPPVQVGTGVQPPLQTGAMVQPPVEIGGVVQSPGLISGLPAHSQQNFIARAPLPLQGPVHIQQPLALAPALGQPAINITQPIGLPTAPVAPMPQQTGIIHVPGKGYLIPLNCIKKEPGLQAALPLLQPKPSEHQTVLDAVASNQAGQWDKPGVSERHQGPESTNPSLSNVTTNIFSGVGVASACPGEHPVTPSSATTPVPQSAENSVSADSVISLKNKVQGSAVDEFSKQDKSINSSQDNAATRPSQSIGQNDLASTNNTKTWKFDPTLPILPPNESTIAGLMAMLLERKRLEVGAKKRARLKNWNVKRKNKGAPDDLLQDALSKEPESSAGTAPESKENNIAKETNTMDVDDQANNNTKREGLWEKRVPVPVGYWKEQRLEDARLAKAKHEETLDRIRNSDWYKTLQPRFLSMFLWPALLSIVGPHRKKVLGLQKKKRPMPQKPVRFAGQASSQADGSKPVGAADGAGKGPGRPWGRKRDGRRKYKTPPPKKSAEEGAERNRKARVKRKRQFKATLGVTRVTRSVTRKQSGVAPPDKDRTMYKVDDVRSDIDEFTSEEEDSVEEVEDLTGYSAHPQAFMAFGYPSVREIIKVAASRTQDDALPTHSESLMDGPGVLQNGVEASQTSSLQAQTISGTPQNRTGILQNGTGASKNIELMETDSNASLLHQSLEEEDPAIPGSSELEVRISSLEASSKNISVSHQRLETIQDGSSVFGNQSQRSSAPQPSSRKRPLEEADVMDTSLKRNKED